MSYIAAVSRTIGNQLFDDFSRHRFLFARLLKVDSGGNRNIDASKLRDDIWIWDSMGKQFSSNSAASFAVLTGIP